MPLRDHFRPPISTRCSWEGFHGMWPAMIVQRLAPLLPDDFTAEPRVHLGTYFEIDVCAYEGANCRQPEFVGEKSGGVATATWTPPQPTLTANLEIWAHPLAIGQPLPTLPLWLSDDRAVSL